MYQTHIALGQTKLIGSVFNQPTGSHNLSTSTSIMPSDSYQIMASFSDIACFATAIKIEIMKKPYVLFLCLLMSSNLDAQSSPEFIIPIQVKDGAGNIDTFWYGYDSQARHELLTVSLERS